MAELTAERLRELLIYNVLNGEFVWRQRRANGSKPGDVAGSVIWNGYRIIGVDRGKYCAHRLAWLYVYGKWPHGEIDHINCNKLDNRIENLREASHSQNLANSYIRKNNNAGLKGVSLHKQSGLYRARITQAGKELSLGYFDTPEAAHAAYCAAAQQLFGEFARAL